MRPPLAAVLRTTAAALAALPAVAVPAAAQGTGSGEGHALAQGAQGRCEMCHVSHTPSRAQFVLRTDPGSASQGLVVMEAEGVTSATLVCLRGHTTEAERRRQPDAAAMPATDGLFLGADLSNDHPLGSIQARERRAARSGFTVRRRVSTAGLLSDVDVMDCTLCHDPHDQGTLRMRPEMQAATCGECHSDQLSRLDGHDELACTGCHQIHGSFQNRLLHESTPEQMCGRCHTPTGGDATAWQEAQGLRASTRTVSARHNPGSDCRECHGIHN